MDDIYPNIYRVTYAEMVGENKADGIVEKVVYIEDVKILKYYRDSIIDIIPISAVYLPQLTEKGISDLFIMLDKINEREVEAELVNKIAEAEAALASLQRKKDIP